MSKELIRTFTDENGQNITFEDIEAAQRELARLESFIGNAITQMAFGLKEIKEKRLYLLRGVDSFRDYCEENLSINSRQAYKYLSIATAYEKQSVDKLQGLSMNKLITLSKDEAFVEGLNDGTADIDGDKVVYADGTVESLSELEARIKRKVEKASQKKLEDQKTLVEMKQGHIDFQDNTIKEQAERIQKLEDMVDTISKTKDLPAERLHLVSTQKNASDLIDDIMMSCISLLGKVHLIDPSIINAEIAGKMSAMMASIESSLYRVREDYADSVLFAQAPRAESFIPE